MNLDTLLLDRAALVNALQEAGVTRWYGRNCRCPFHHDRHPSAGIYQAKHTGHWLFACLACGIEAGDVIHVLSLTRNCSRTDIIRHLQDTGELLAGETPAQRTVTRPAPSPPPYADIAAEIQFHRDEADPEWLAMMADNLGVSRMALIALRCGWCEKPLADPRNVPCASFPMTDATGQDCGIRYRWDNAAKKARYGGRSGLFIPHLDNHGDNVLWVCEGPTDTAAMLTLGLWAVGLPGASQGIDILSAFIEANRPRFVVAVADAGQAGHASATLAATTARAILGEGKAKVLDCPDEAKDIRAWIGACRDAGHGMRAIKQKLAAALAATKAEANKQDRRAA